MKLFTRPSIRLGNLNLVSKGLVACLLPTLILANQQGLRLEMKLAKTELKYAGIDIKGAAGGVGGLILAIGILWLIYTCIKSFCCTRLGRDAMAHVARAAEPRQA